MFRKREPLKFLSKPYGLPDSEGQPDVRTESTDFSLGGLEDRVRATSGVEGGTLCPMSPLILGAWLGNKSGWDKLGRGRKRYQHG
jgi:hypothetical protein